MSFVPTAAAVLNPWVRILGALEKKISRQPFESQLKPTRFSRMVGKTLYVRIPAASFEHIGDKYAQHIDEAIDKLGLEIESVVFETAAKDPASPKMREDGGFAPVPAHSANAPRPAGSAGASGSSLRSNSSTGSTGAAHAGGNAPATGTEQARFDWNTAAQLNPRYQFDGFVPGSGNQFALAAAVAVAERPSKAYNPLFLYGGVGMGKTHLLHAIGHEVKRRQPHAAIRYLSGEKFTNEMIDALRFDKITGFRDKYRTVDVLLIDDIQFLAGKERRRSSFSIPLTRCTRNRSRLCLRATGRRRSWATLKTACAAALSGV